MTAGLPACETHHMTEHSKIEAVQVTNDAEGQQLQCAGCKKLASPQHKPFCSKRCADVDLHRWLSGSYAIPVPPGEEESTGMDDDEGLS